MSATAGAGILVRLGLRRDRIRLLVWVAVFALLAAGTAGATVDLYPTVASRVEAATAINNSPALVALYGPILDPRSLGALSLLKLVNLGAALVAVLTAMTTVRHTRAEEESGRLELVGAGVVGRGAPLAAALVLGAFMSLAVGIGCTLGLVAGGLPLAGSVAFGASWAGVGLVFAGVAAVAAQVAQAARNATGLALGTLGAAYVLRAVGDANDSVGWLVWLSPLGWGHRVGAFAGERWWVLLLPVAATLALAAVAATLSARRDLGAGVLPDRSGPARGGRGLADLPGLAWRLERAGLLAWAGGFVFAGVLMGALAGEVGSIVTSDASREYIRRLGGEKGMAEAYLAAVLGVSGLLAAAYGVHTTLRLRAEETSQRADAVLATGVSRRRWALTHLGTATAGTVVLVLTVGITGGLARSLQVGDLSDLPGVLAGALVQLPAVWVVMGIALAAYGVGARFAAAGWAALVVFLLLGTIGALFDLPRRVVDLSPFTHVPQLPGGTVHVAPLLVLLLIAAALDGVGLFALGRRDLG